MGEILRELWLLTLTFAARTDGAFWQNCRLGIDDRWAGIGTLPGTYNRINRCAGPCQTAPINAASRQHLPEREFMRSPGPSRLFVVPVLTEKVDRRTVFTIAGSFLAFCRIRSNGIG